MRVECERCKTEYQFDDAIVSVRGTTVRCTNCGHQFRVKKPEGEAGDDRFNVRRGDGTEITFESLRELQRAILSKAILREDVLVRGSIKRELGTIAELRPLFEEKRASGRPSGQPRSNPPNTAPLFEKTLRMGSVPTIPPPPGNAPGPGPAADTRPASSKKASVPPPPLPAERAPLAPPPQHSHAQKPVSASPSALGSGTVAMQSTPLASHVAIKDVEREEPSQPALSGAAAFASKTSTMRPASAGMPPVPSAPVSTARAEPEPETLRRMEDPVSDAETPLAHSAAERFDPLERGSGRISRPPPLPTRASQRPNTFTPSATPALPKEITAPIPSPVAAAPPPPSLDLKPGARSEPRGGASAGLRSNRPPPAVSGPPPRLLGDSAAAKASAPPPPPLGDGKRPVGGYVVGGAVLAGLLVLAFVALRDRDGGRTGTDPGPTSSASVTSDTESRVTKFMDASKKALSTGDIDGAKENVDKASAIAETDARVIALKNRITIARADLAWIAREATSTKNAVDAKVAADRATETASRLSTVDRAQCSPACRVDLERLQGNSDEARERSHAIPEPAGLDGKYARAAVALLEKRNDGAITELSDMTHDPAFGARERALLALAHARAGQADKAREVLSGGAIPAYVAAPIAALLPESPVAAVDAAAAIAANSSGMVDPGPGSANAGTPGSSGTAGGTEVLNGADPRDVMKAAEQARGKGDFDRAMRLYAIALDKNPRDSEALNGIADIEHAQHNLAAAKSSYQKVLNVNGSYLPALLGLADVQYESGDAAGAQRTYHDIMDRFPDGSYPARVRQRGEASAPAPTPAPKPTEASPSPGGPNAGGPNAGGPNAGGSSSSGGPNAGGPNASPVNTGTP